MPRLDPAGIRRIALINFGGIGDEILFTPVIADIRRHLPDAILVLFLEKRSQAVVELLPKLDAVETVELQGASRFQLFKTLVSRLRKGRFDVVISSGSNPLIPVMLAASGIPIRVGYETGLLSRVLLSAPAPLNKQTYAARMYAALGEAFLRWLLGNQYTPTPTILPSLRALDAAERNWAYERLYQPDARPKVLIHPGVSLVSIEKNMLKSWSAANWAMLIQQLAERYQVYLVGGPDDRQIVADITASLPPELPNFQNLYGETRNLRQLAALINACDVLVSADSSPLHVAVGYAKPVVAMFGPTDERKLVPADDRFRAVTVSNLACRPCLWDVRQESCDNPVCLNVEVAAMVQAVDAVLARSDFLSRP